MFNPDRVSALKRLPINLAEVTRFDSHFIEAQEVALPPKPTFSALPDEYGGLLYPPVRIFGIPVDPECLTGVGCWPVSTPQPTLSVHIMARVIGFTSILTSDNRLLCPDEIFAGNVSEFITRNTYNHLGHTLDEVDSRLIVRFGCRAYPNSFAQHAFFLPNIEPGNYGSFIFRQLPQVLSLAEQRPRFDCFIASERTPWLLEVLSLIGLSAYPVYEVKEISGDTFASISVYSGFDAEGFIDPETKRRFRNLVSATTGLVRRTSVAKKLYVSRMLSAVWRPNYRVMENSRDLEHIASQRGFDILYPETLSFLDQMRAFSGAKCIVGPSGSGMFNVAFSLQSARVVDIETYHVTVRQHAKFYASCEADYAFLFCPPNDSTGGMAGINSNYKVDLKLFFEAIDWVCVD